MARATVGSDNRHARTRGVLTASAALMCVVLLMVGCGSSKASAGGGEVTPSCRTAAGGKVTITAKNSKWDTSCIQVTGTSLTITLDNTDHGILHNIDVKDAPGAPKTELAAGPVTQTLVVKGLKPGKTYTYICDLHANMIGDIEVLK